MEDASRCVGMLIKAMRRLGTRSFAHDGSNPRCFGDYHRGQCPASIVRSGQENGRSYANSAPRPPPEKKKNFFLILSKAVENPRRRCRRANGTLLQTVG